VTEEFNSSLYSISVSAKPAAWSSSTSFEILLLMADLRKVGQSETKENDLSPFVPLSNVHSLGNRFPLGNVGTFVPLSCVHS
jgi:hypothetical protein